MDPADRSQSLTESQPAGVPHPGLPAPLPPGEHIVWQGAPRGHNLARQVFHTRLIWLYFAILAIWRAAAVIEAGREFGDIVLAVLIVGACGALVVGILELLAWLSARATVYTITNHRILMRIGAALTKTIDIPFKVIDQVDLKAGANGTGNISIKLKDDAAIAYLILWPHVRPWRLRRPEPMLRAVPNVRDVAAILASRLRASAAAEAGNEVLAQDAPAASEAPASAEPSPAGTARVPLIAAAALVALSLLTVVWFQIVDPRAAPQVSRSPIAVHELRFVDLEDDQIAIVDAGVGETIAVIEPGGDNLVRNAVLSLTRTRDRRGLPIDSRYQLVHWDTGRVTLSDLETDRHIPIDSFGPTNSGALARLLSLKTEPPVG